MCLCVCVSVYLCVCVCVCVCECVCVSVYLCVSCLLVLNRYAIKGLKSTTYEHRALMKRPLPVEEWWKPEFSYELCAFSLVFLPLRVV